MNTLRAFSQLNQLLENTKILVEQPRLDPWLARVLITELLWGKKKLQSEAKPIQTILAYTDKLREEVKNLECPKPVISHKDKGKYVNSSIKQNIFAYLQRFGSWRVVTAQ